MKPRVSVIIPAYNRAVTISAAIESARAQTEADIEIIVVDDGSTDETAALVHACTDPRVHLIAHQQNSGAAAARNSGIAAARADFVALLDSDDVWHPTKLARQLAILDAAPPGVDAVTCGVHMRLMDQGYESDIIPAQEDDWKRRLAVDCNLSPGTTLVAQRSLFDWIGPMDEALPRFEDWDWLLRYAASGGLIHVVPEVLAIVNNRRGRLGRPTELAAQRFAAKHRPLWASFGLAFARRAEASLWMQVAGTYAYGGDMLGFARVFARAFELTPSYAVNRVFRAGSRYRRTKS